MSFSINFVKLQYRIKIKLIMPFNIIINNIKAYRLFLPKGRNQMAYEIFRLVISILFSLGGASFSNYLYFQYNPFLGVALVGESLVACLFFSIIYFVTPLLSKAILEDIKKMIQQLIIDNIVQFNKRNYIKKQKRLPRIVKNTIYPIVLDTSTIIDGRFKSLIDLGLIHSQIIVPQFVLSELHTLSDSKSKLKRDRGRRGLQILQDIKKSKGRGFEVYPSGSSVVDVDSELIVLCKKIKAQLATTDYNLSKIAQIKNIKVLNINKLAMALKTVLIPGDKITLQITKAGSENNQGVGYLEDGTMVVVSGGSKLINKYVNLEITKVIQKETGKIIFADITTSN